MQVKRFLIHITWQSNECYRFHNCYLPYSVSFFPYSDIIKGYVAALHLKQNRTITSSSTDEQIRTLPTGFVCLSVQKSEMALKGSGLWALNTFPL